MKFKIIFTIILLWSKLSTASTKWNWTVWYSLACSNVNSIDSLLSFNIFMLKPFFFNFIIEINILFLRIAIVNKCHAWFLKWRPRGLMINNSIFKIKLRIISISAFLSLGLNDFSAKHAHHFIVVTQKFCLYIKKTT